MCVMYVSFGSKVRSRTFGCVALTNAVLFILRPRPELVILVVVCLQCMMLNSVGE